MSKKISQLTETPTVADADVFAVVSGGATKKVKKENILKEVVADLGAHTEDETIHFTEAEIGITESQVANLVGDLASKASSAALASHTGNTSNPHSVTKSQVGLGNVDNTADTTKPVSTAQQTALDGKSDVGHTHDDRYYTETEVDTLLDGKADVGEVDITGPLDITNAPDAGTPGNPSQITTGDPNTKGLVLKGSRYDSGSTPFGSGAPPNTITGLLAWWKADAITGLSDGAPVSSWPDSSVNGNNATQASSGNRPLYKTNILNGKPVVRFDGSNDFLEFSELINIRSAFFVVKHNTGNQDYAPLLGHSSLYDWAGGEGSALFEPTNTDADIRNGTIQINGIDDTPVTAVKPTEFVAISVVAVGDTRAQFITNDRNAGRYWNGDFAEIILFSTSLSDADRDAVRDYLRTKYNLTSIQVLRQQLILDGNSMTNNSYKVRIGLNLSEQWSISNFGVSGQATPSMIADADTQIDPLFSINRPRNIVVAWEGSNDLYFGATATEAYDNLVSYCNDRRDAGWKVVIVTLLPRSSSGTPGTFEADRQTVNANIRANWSTFADALADIAANTTIGEDGDETDTTYYSDAVHPTDAAYDIIAPIVADAIESISAATSTITEQQEDIWQYINPDDEILSRIDKDGVFHGPAVYADSVGVGTDTPSGNAKLEIVSTDKGFLPPRMTTTQRDAINATEGLVVYNVSTHKLNVYTVSAWEEVTSA